MTTTFLLSLLLWLQGTYLFNGQNVEKCVDDLNGTTPYVVPQGQSVLSYDPTVVINKTQPYSTCTWVPEGYTSNPKKDCPLNAQYVLTPIIPMSTSTNLRNTINQARQFIINSSMDISNIHLGHILAIHCSIEYFSCYNYFEYLLIQKVLRNFKWNSFIITFNKVTCDVSTVASYLLVEADSSSQKKLFDFVRKLERKIIHQGIQIKIPRIEKFHITLARVDYTYPSDCMIDKLTTKLIPQLKHQQFGSVRICCFILTTELSTTYYYAQDCSKNDFCVSDIK